MKINSDVTAGLEYYLSRRDKIFITEDGDFKAIKGVKILMQSSLRHTRRYVYINYSYFHILLTSDVEITFLR